MKKSVLWVMVVSAVVLTACCTTKVSSITKQKRPTTPEVMADLDIRSEKVSHTYQTTVKKEEMVNEIELRETAVFEALKKVGADVLVAPQFMISKKVCKRIKTYEVTVTGYPAFYVNMRQMPVAERLELRELKEGKSYVVVKKSADGRDVEIDTALITTPNMDLQEMEKVLNNRGRCRKEVGK